MNMERIWVYKKTIVITKAFNQIGIYWCLIEMWYSFRAICDFSLFHSLTLSVPSVERDIPHDLSMQIYAIYSTTAQPIQSKLFRFSRIDTYSTNTVEFSGESFVCVGPNAIEWVNSNSKTKTFAQCATYNNNNNIKINNNNEKLNSLNLSGWLSNWDASTHRLAVLSLQ